MPHDPDRPPVALIGKDIDDTSLKTDIGHYATWSVSSSKPGFGVDALLNPSLKNYWQSEGPQPHFINIQFPKRMSVCQISLHVDVQLDDSYTPQKISIRAGTYYGDLQEVKSVDMADPKGWTHFQLGNIQADDDDPDLTDPEAFAIRANLIQLAILSNHLNGKDTHVRHIKIFAPRQPEQLGIDDLGPFTTEAMLMHQTVR